MTSQSLDAGLGTGALKLEFLTVSRFSFFCKKRAHFHPTRSPRTDFNNFCGVGKLSISTLSDYIFGGLFHVSIVENPRKVPLSLTILDFRSDLLDIYGSIHYEYGSISIKNSGESILINALAIATAKN